VALRKMRKKVGITVHTPAHFDQGEPAIAPTRSLGAGNRSAFTRRSVVEQATKRMLRKSSPATLERTVWISGIPDAHGA
jgi:hypothetical protein